MPMKAIGMLLGIPDEDQAEIRDRIDAGMKMDESGARVEGEQPAMGPLDGSGFADYIELRSENPSNDLMTELLNAEFQDETGTTRKLTRDEIVNYVGLLAAAGNETTTRLIGWTGKVLAENPEHRAELHADRSLIPNAIEELLRYESPSPVQARYVAADVAHHRQTAPAGSIMLAITASANRDARDFRSLTSSIFTARWTTTWPSATGSTSGSAPALARLEVALDEVLNRFPTWQVDWDNAVQGHTSTVRGWEKLPVLV
jgi:cytochrome P450